jgi:hypothetical protein
VTLLWQGCAPLSRLCRQPRKTAVTAVRFPI